MYNYTEKITSKQGFLCGSLVKCTFGDEDIHTFISLASSAPNLLEQQKRRNEQKIRVTIN